MLPNLQYQFPELFCMLSTAHSTWQQILLVAVRPGEVAQATGIQAEKLKAVPETGGIKSHSYSLFEWHPSCLPTSSKTYQERDFTSKSASSETPPFFPAAWMVISEKEITKLHTEVYSKLNIFISYPNCKKNSSTISIWLLLLYTTIFRCISCQCFETKMNGMDFK